MTQVPDLSRGLVILRDRYLCQRCGLRGTDKHHRRSRSVVDEHRHCPCNLILLCRTCHSWAHANPYMARACGLIVSRWVTEPGTIPIQTILGTITTDCDGGFLWS